MTQNKRYPNLSDSFFVAGDEDQFESTREKSDVVGPPDPNPDIWDGYKDRYADSVYHTFQYIFHKLKKGVFVKIKDNKVVTFLPFSKVKFVNEWHDQIHVDPKYRNGLNDFLSYVAKLENRQFNPSLVNKNINEWYANNGLIRYDFMPGDTGYDYILDMMTVLCDSKQVPDIEFFFNRRDFPILTTNYTEPYDEMFGSDVPLQSFTFNKYAPILSCATRSGYADIAVPTIDDWARVRNADNIIFKKMNRNFSTSSFQLDWKKKINKAVFRGSSNGLGTTMETNPRLKLASMKNDLLDVGITKWNLRPRKTKDSLYLQTIDVPSLPFSLVPELTLEQQSQYKYVIHIEGHSAAFRLSLELAMGSVILIVESKYKLWFSHLLKPYEHFIPVKSDLSDLQCQVEWCMQHDAECQQIAVNSLIFYNTYLGKESMLLFLQEAIKSHSQSYKYHPSPLSYQLKIEYSALTTYDHPELGKDVKQLYAFPLTQNARSLSFLDGVRFTFNFLLRNKVITIDTSKKENEIYNTVNTKVSNVHFNGLIFIAKVAKNEMKKNELIHDAYVGIKAMNGMRQFIPNFVYTFAFADPHVVITEKIEGSSLFSQLKYLSLSEIAFVFMQVCLAIHHAQRTTSFVHYDLTPWNIMLSRIPGRAQVDYIMSVDKVAAINTSTIPIIIDYGKSHIFRKNRQFGMVNMFSFREYQDILTLVFTTMKAYIKVNNCTDKHRILHLINFFSDTPYLPKPICKFENLESQLQVLGSYSALLTAKGLTQTPLKLFDRLYELFPENQKFVQFKATSNRAIYRGSAKQVFEYTFSKSREEKISSYLRVFHDILTANQNRMELQSYLLDDIYMRTYFIVTSVYEQLKKEFPGEDYTLIYEKSLEVLKKDTDTNSASDLVSIEFLKKAKFIKCEIDEHFFQNQMRVQIFKSLAHRHLISEHCELRMNIESLIVFGKALVPEKNRLSYLNQYNKFLLEDKIHLQYLSAASVKYYCNYYLD